MRPPSVFPRSEITKKKNMATVKRGDGNEIRVRADRKRVSRRNSWRPQPWIVFLFYFGISTSCLSAMTNFPRTRFGHAHIFSVWCVYCVCISLTNLSPVANFPNPNVMIVALRSTETGKDIYLSLKRRIYRPTG